jgi:hypothetical protein
MITDPEEPQYCEDGGVKLRSEEVVKVLAVTIIVVIGLSETIAVVDGPTNVVVL